MRRIEIHDEDGRQFSVDGVKSEQELKLSSRDDVTFPGVWLDGERVYDVEVWQGDQLLLAVPPRSDDVDQSFDEHERQRS